MSADRESRARRFGRPTSLVLGPEDGEVILQPEHDGSGYWVGAPSVLHDGEAGCWWLTYRRRRPRGVNPDGLGERGYLARVARSSDGLNFEDVWEVRQAEWSTPSMERFCLARDSEVYRLYVSYVDPADNRWRIDYLEASHPSRFDSAALHPVLTADTVPDPERERLEGVKDPWVFQVEDTWHMLISYAGSAPGPERDRGRMHQTADVYNTGLITAPTGLATSVDGRHWDWQGRILDTGLRGAWDGYQSRLTAVVPIAGVWLGFYDGSGSHEQNYEEQCGLAISTDLRHWSKLTPERPAVVSSGGSGSVRYVDATWREGAVHCYYEYARPDGAHALRRLVVQAAST